MRIYSDEAEDNLHAQIQTRAWVRNGFLTPEQKQALDALIPVSLRRTNIFLRVLLLVFTVLLVGAVVALLHWLWKPQSSQAIAMLCLVCAIPTYIGAELAAGRGRLYRYGIEEGLGFGAVVLFCGAVEFLLPKSTLTQNAHIMVMASVIAVSLLWLYARFGWITAAWASILALSFIPFQFSLSPIQERLLLTALLSLMFAITFLFSTHTRPDFVRSRNQLLQAGLLVGIYLTLNFQLESLPLFRAGWEHQYGDPTRASNSSVYWFTYVMCWVYPLALIGRGLVQRKRVLVDVGLLSFGITLATNKDYSGLAHQPWDPIVFGAFLMTLAAVTHWLLANKARSERWRLTNKNILRPENHGIEIAAAGVAIAGPVTHIAPSSTTFGAGGSGGAGASRRF